MPNVRELGQEVREILGSRKEGGGGRALGEIGEGESADASNGLPDHNTKKERQRKKKKKTHNPEKGQRRPKKKWTGNDSISVGKLNLMRLSAGGVHSGFSA